MINILNQLTVPDHAAWEGYQGDLDARYLHGIFFQKSIDEVQSNFDGNGVIDRSSELLFVPRAVFQYYIWAFALFLQSEKAQGESDSASCFLQLLIGREIGDPGSVADIAAGLLEVVDYVAANQAYFEADVDIYGDFQTLAMRIRGLCPVESSASHGPSSK